MRFISHVAAITNHLIFKIMKYYVEESLNNFKFWSGGKDTADGLTFEQIDAIEGYLEQMYPDGCYDTDINDFFWFERDFIYKEILHCDEDGNEIGSTKWAEKVLDSVSEDLKYIVELYMDDAFFEGDFNDKESLLENFDEYIENFKDMNGDFIHVGDKCHWFDPAVEDYETDEEYNEQCETIREIVEIRSDMVVLDGDTEVLAEEIEIIHD